jgi:uncharacterized protein YutE (UPF0331/DUF86 family)
MFNSYLIYDKLNDIENLLKNFKEEKNILAKYYIFIVLLQVIIDISFILIINLKLKKPKNYLEIFDILNSSKVINNETAISLRLYSALRNKLIYNYNEMENNEVEIMLNKFDTICMNFICEVREYIKEIS